MGSTVFYQPEVRSDNRIGVETINGNVYDCPAPYWGYECRRADAAFVEFDSGITEDMGHIARTTGNGSITINTSYPRWRVVSETSSGVVGQILVIVGRSTGTYTPILQNLCVNVINEEDIIMVCQDIASAPHLADGDSGAPVFKITNSPKYGDVSLYGILWAADSETMSYSPMDQIQRSSELGSIRTCAREIGC